eukprot:GHVR01181062.1.p1 GENE.GHVR01181062.1~~GHVR01181062.1.p1  ORF type:complete len:418 (+),score=72.24 GHVR01181062.1:118-1254(+)
MFLDSVKSNDKIRKQDKETIYTGDVHVSANIKHEETKYTGDDSSYIVLMRDRMDMAIAIVRQNLLDSFSSKFIDCSNNNNNSITSQFDCKTKLLKLLQNIVNSEKDENIINAENKENENEKDDNGDTINDNIFDTFNIFNIFTRGHDKYSYREKDIHIHSDVYSYINSLKKYLKGLIMSKQFNELNSFNNNNNNISIIDDIYNILTIPLYSCSSYSACKKKHTLSSIHRTNIFITINRPKCIYDDIYLNKHNSNKSLLCTPLSDNNLSQVLSEDTTRFLTDSKDILRDFKPYIVKLSLQKKKTNSDKYVFLVSDDPKMTFETESTSGCLVQMLSVPVPTVEPAELIEDTTEDIPYGCKHDVLTLILDRQIQVLLISTT